MANSGEFLINQRTYPDQSAAGVMVLDTGGFALA
jgi:hypothetical protein